MSGTVTRLRNRFFYVWCNSFQRINAPETHKLSYRRWSFAKAKPSDRAPWRVCALSLWYFSFPCSRNALQLMVSTGVLQPCSDLFNVRATSYLIQCIYEACKCVVQLLASLTLIEEPIIVLVVLVSQMTVAHIRALKSRRSLKRFVCRRAARSIIGTDMPFSYRFCLNLAMVFMSDK